MTTLSLSENTVETIVETVKRKGDWIQTYSSMQFWPLEPKAEDFNIYDIAHALSMVCRFNGHCLRYYSVAEHSILLALHFMEKGERDNALWALLHDGTEAYLCDIPKPVKPFLSGYKELEDVLMKVIAEKFELVGEDMPVAVKAADYSILFAEAEQNMSPAPAVWNSPVAALDVKLQYWTPEQAKRNFLHVFDVLTNPDKELDYYLIFANDNPGSIEAEELTSIEEWLNGNISEDAPRRALENLLAYAQNLKAA